MPLDSHLTCVNLSFLWESRVVTLWAVPGTPGPPLTAAVASSLGLLPLSCLLPCTLHPEGSALESDSVPLPQDRDLSGNSLCPQDQELSLRVACEALGEAGPAPSLPGQPPGNTELQTSLSLSLPVCLSVSFSARSLSKQPGLQTMPQTARSTR